MKIGLLGAEIQANTMEYAEDGFAFNALATRLRLDEIERRILLLEEKRKNDRFAAGFLPEPSP